MQQSYARLFENNRKWVSDKLNLDPDYFKKMAEGQKPKYLFIGCSDSRVPANEITGTEPGEMFVHRNIANMVVHTDMNLMSVLQYAVQVLKVEHVIVCGHYGCGGVAAAMGNKSLGLIDAWLRNIKDSYSKNRDYVEAAESDDARFRRLVESNVKEQVFNLHMTSIVQMAKNAGQDLQVHGWVYDLHDGLLNDLEIDHEKHFTDFDLYEFDK
ncbi:carbonic anhydrase [Marivirga sp. S37H4]|uniref:Carbonic anhydrase n=1 Tax=Marivirga aurantiaca TaxID=2802615 RepID=A0A935CAX6_9BACT|nr:carbonic anhydrase [Marivirga aurantiaca]MBK6266457.1 carbonic anhydrase [Marivirga aurantiaca]